jgi:hypothetical protein
MSRLRREVRRFVAAPTALIGGILGIWAKGGMRVAGLVLNIVAFLITAALIVLVILGVAIQGLGPAGSGGWGRPSPTPTRVTPSVTPRRR